MSRHAIGRARFLDDAFLVAQRFTAGYRGYETEPRALSAFRRRAPGFSKAQYEYAFEKALNLYASALKVIKRSLPTLRARWKIPQQSGHQHNLRPLMLRLRRQAPGFLASTYFKALNWVWYWHYLK